MTQKAQTAGNIPDDTDPVVITGNDGRVMAQNEVARGLLGSANGRYCWDVVGGLEGAEDLPCRRGCVMELLERTGEAAQHVRVKVNGVRHELTCSPVDGVAVCVLHQLGSEGKSLWKDLSPREQEILALLAEGEVNGTMADMLGVSEATVRTHIERMRSKLCANTRAAMVAEGFRLGYLE